SELGYVPVSWGMTASNLGEVKSGCGLFARLFFRAAYSLINLQYQKGHQYPSRFSLRMLQYAANQGHVKAMAQLGGLLYQCGVGRADKRSGLEYLRKAAKVGNVD